MPSLHSVIGAIVDSYSNLVLKSYSIPHFLHTKFINHSGHGNTVVPIVMQCIYSQLRICCVGVWGVLPIRSFPQQPSCTTILSWKGLFLSFLSRQKHEYNYCAMYGICGAREDGKALNCPNYVLATEVVLSVHLMWIKIDWMCQLLFSEFISSLYLSICLFNKNF